MLESHTEYIKFVADTISRVCATDVVAFQKCHDEIESLSSEKELKDYIFRFREKLERHNIKAEGFYKETVINNFCGQNDEGDGSGYSIFKDLLAIRLVANMCKAQKIH